MKIALQEEEGTNKGQRREREAGALTMCSSEVPVLKIPGGGEEGLRAAEEEYETRAD